MTENDTALQKYDGSCQCGAQRYTIYLPAASPDGGPGWRPAECNCSICRKKGALWAFAGTTANLHAQNYSDEILSYRFGEHKWSHQFCSICGVNVEVSAVGDTLPVAANARTLKGVDILSLETKPIDGKSAGRPYKPKAYAGSPPPSPSSTSSKPLATELYHGSCHCGAITYAARFPPLETLRATAGLLYRPDDRNDAALAKYGVLGVDVPDGQLRMHCEGGLGCYDADDDDAREVRFCRTCGVTVAWQDLAERGRDSVALNLRTLDVEGWEERLGL